MRSFAGLIGIAFVFAFLLGCAGSGDGNGGGGSFFGPVNGSSFEGKYAKEGDTVIADYTLYLQNGTMLESTQSKTALEGGVYRLSKQYVPISFALEQGNGLLPKFTNAFVGMYEGQKKRITLSPAEAYGEENASMVVPNTRFVTGTRFERVPMSVFVEKKIEVKPNSTVSMTYWNATVIDISTSAGDVLIRYEPVLGQRVMWFDIPGTVTEIGNETFTYRLDPVVGEVYKVPHPDDKNFLTKVTFTRIENETVWVNQNHPLAGKTLVFEIELLKIKQEGG